MKITTIKTFSHLDHIIDGYWHYVLEGINSKILLMPILNHQIIIDYSENVVLGKNNSDCISVLGNNFVMGLRTKPLSIINEGKNESIRILLRPHGLYQLFGIDSSECIKMEKRIRLIFGDEFEEVRRQIRLESDPEMKLHILDSYIISVSKCYEIEKSIYSFYEELKLNLPGKRQIGNYVEKIQKSHSSFIQTFKKVYGITPKQLILLMQINKSIQAILECPGQPLVEIAIDSGFYDQAHFIKTFKRYTGFLPSEYKNKVEDGKVMYELSNFVSLN